MPRFALLRHAQPQDSPCAVHWDLFLEDGDTLLTWALAELPAARRTIAAQALPNHRLAYLDYQGPVSGNRGTVTRTDAGSFAWQQRSVNEIVVQLEGQRLQGQASLVRVTAETRDWHFRLQPEPAPPPE
jgi:hypothetical protein